jgi:uncharacterized membrane protein YgcG
MKLILPLLALFISSQVVQHINQGKHPTMFISLPNVNKVFMFVQMKIQVTADMVQQNRDQDYYEMQNDRYLRMRVGDRNRWSYVDDYYRNPFAYNYYSNHHYYNNTYWNARNYWNYYYNPYATPVIVMNPKSAIPNTPRRFNLHVFDSPETSSKNPKMPANRYREYSTPSNQRSVDNSRSRGNELRDMFGNRGNNSSSNSNSSEGTKSSSNNSGSSGSSGSKGSNTPVRKF